MSTFAVVHRGPRFAVAVFAVAFAAALIALFTGASSASASFAITDFTLTPSTTQAGGHPDTHYHVDPDAPLADNTNGDDLKKVVLDFPAGLLGNPEAASPKCSTSQFNNDACPASSYIGSMSVKWREKFWFWSTTASAPGSVYVLNPPTAGSAITVGFILRPQGFRKIFLKTEVTGVVTVRSGTEADYGLTLVVDNIPRTMTTSFGFSRNITFNDITVDINNRANTTKTGPYFTFNPTRCSEAKTRATITSYKNVVVTRETAFTPTGCDQVPFSATANVTPTDPAPGVSTGVSATFTAPTADAPIQNSHIAAIQVDLPAGTNLDFPAISAIPETCTEAQVNADNCPAGSKIGTVSAAVPFLPPTMTGDVYLINRNNGIVFGYVLRGANGVKASLKGQSFTPDIDGDGSADLVRTIANNMPQAPWSSATITFDAALVKNPTGCGAHSVSSTIHGWSGASVSTSNQWSDNGACDSEAPVVDITAPADGTSTTASSIGLQFTVTDDSGQAPTCDRESGTSVTLANGANTITVTCTDAAGNSGSDSVTVVRQYFDPQASASFSSPRARSLTDLTVEFSTPGDGNATIRAASTTLGLGVLRNPAAFGAAADYCPVPGSPASFDPSQCPAQALVGEASISAPSLAEPLVGGVYLFNYGNGIGLIVSVTGGGVTHAFRVDASKVWPYGGFCDPLDPFRTCGQSWRLTALDLPPIPNAMIELTFGGDDRIAADGSTLSGKLFRLSRHVCSAADPNLYVRYTAVSHQSFPNSSSTDSIPLDGCGDTSAPYAAILTPLDNAYYGTRQVELTYAPPGDGVTCDHPNNSDVLLAEDTTTLLTLTCTDSEGNTDSDTVEVEHYAGSSPDITVDIVSPQNGQFVDSSSVAVDYQVNVRGNENPSLFQHSCNIPDGSSVPLTGSQTVITVRCTLKTGAYATDSVTVNRDVQPPQVLITSPADGSATTLATTTLNFSATDDSGQAPACDRVSGSSVSLVLGSNTITVTCTDAAGNSGSDTVTVHRKTFAPNFEQTIGNPVAGEPTPYAITLSSTGANASAIRSAAITLSPSLYPNFAALGDPSFDMCPVETIVNLAPPGSPAQLTFDNANPSYPCPAQATVGTATFSSTAGGAVNGTIQLIEKSAIPNFGIALENGARMVMMSSVVQGHPLCDPLTSICDQSIRLTVDGLPNVDDSSIALSLDGPDRIGSLGQTLPGQIFRIADVDIFGICNPSVTSQALMAPWAAGLPVTDSDSDEIDCGDVTPPVVTITSPVDGLITGASSVNVNYTVTDDLDPSPTCSIANGSSVPLAPGMNTITVTCADDAGNAGSDSVTVERYDSPPVVTITSPPNGSTTTNSSIAVNFTVSDDGGAVTCNFASGTVFALAPGVNVITITCTDAAGNTGSASVIIYRISSLTVTITDGPADGSVISDTTPTFTYQSNVPVWQAPYCPPGVVCPAIVDQVVGFRCTLDGGAEFGCPANLASGGTYTTPVLEDGSHTFCVTAYFMSGSGQSAPDCRSFQVQTGPPPDTGAPVVTITSPADGTVTSASSIQVHYTVIDNFDGSPTCNIASGATVALAPGLNTITVECTDDAGNVGSDSVTVERYNSPPLVTITSPANNSQTTASSVTLNYSVVGGSGSSSCDKTNGSSQPLALGANTITVTCVDDAGNTGSASVTVRRKTFAPTYDQTLSNPVAGENTGLTIEFASTGTNASAIRAAQAKFGTALVLDTAALGDGSVDMCPWETLVNSAPPGSPSQLEFDYDNPSFPCPPQAKVGTATFSSPSLAQPKQGEIMLIDKAPIQNLGIKPLGSDGFTAVFISGMSVWDPSCDPTLEVCDQTWTITGTNLPDIGDSTISLNFDGPDRVGSYGTLNGKIFKVATAEDTVCDGTLESSGTMVPWATGSNVTDTDSDPISGCGGGGDTTPPVVTITSPPDGLVTLSSTVTLNYVATDDSGVTPTCDRANGSTVTLTPGVNTITVTCTDGAGNSASDSVTVEYYDGPPAIFNLTLTPPPPYVPGQQVTLTYDVSEPATCTPPSGSSITLQAGANTIVVTCTDQAGNVGSESLAIVVNSPSDTTPPVISITAPANNSETTAASTTLSYVATDDTDPTPTCTPASGSSVSLALGANTITVTCTDDAGNVGSTSVTVHRKTFAPTYDQTLSNPVAGENTGLTIQLSSLGTDASAIRGVVMRTGAALFVDLTQVGDYDNDMCPVSSFTYNPGPPPWTSFDPSACPAQAKVGTATLSSPDLAEPMLGEIMLVSKAPIPNFGIKPIGANGLSAAFGTSTQQYDPSCDPLFESCDQTLAISSARLPDVGDSTISLSFDGPDRVGSGGQILDGQIFRVASQSDSVCDGTLESNALFGPWATGGNATDTDSDSIDCGPPPDDNEAPQITITSPVAGSYTNVATATLLYAVTDDSGLQPVCTVPSGTEIPLSEGANTIAVSCTDDEGATATRSFQITLDTIAPDPHSLACGPAATPASSCVLTYGLTEVNPGSPNNGCTPANGATITLAPGPNTITVNCSDRAGNSGSESIVVVSDNVAPTVTITSPVDGSPPGEYTLAYDESDNIDTSLDCSPAEGSTVTLSEWQPVTVICTDDAGNVGSDTVLSGDPGPPTTSIVSYAAPSTGSPASGPAGPALAVSFGGTNANGFECRVDGGAWSTCTSPWTVPTSGLTSPAEHNYEIRAFNGNGSDPTPAQGFVWVDDRNYNAAASATAVPNSLEPTAAEANDAGAHPNITATLSLEGYDDPQSANVTGPDGLMGSLRAVPKSSRCSVSDATAGNCPSSSLVGTAIASATFASDGTVTANGNVYLVDSEGLPASDAAGVAVEFEDITGSVSGNLGDVVAQGALRINDQARNLRLLVNDIPRQTSDGARFHLRSGSVTVQGDTRPDMGAPPSETNPPLITNQHTCVSPGTGRPNYNRFVGTGTGWNGSVTPTITATYAVDNCAAVPFNPTIDYAFSDLTAGNGTELTVTASVPYDHSTFRAVQATLPPFAAANTAAFGDASVDQCPVETIRNATQSGTPVYNYFDYENPSFPCPAQARVGTVSVESPLLEAPVTGTVWLIEKAPIPNIGIEIDADTPGNPQGVNLGLVGTTATVQYVPGCDPLFETCDQAIRATFPSLPDVPVSSMEIKMGTVPGRTDSNGNPLQQHVIKIAAPADSVCRNAGDNVQTTLVPWRGSPNAARTQLVQPEGCFQ